ncbi:MAG: hypothetical protein CME70_06295 [Halobacteriovorax sp.]|nr:hypothetical protein [Halobacteriovorax sp.]
MKISTKNFFKKKKIIEVPKAFAAIVGIDEYGRFLYNINYIASIPDSIRNKVTTVKLSAYTHDPLVRSSMFGNSVAAEDVIKNIRNYATRVKDRITAARKDPIVVKNSDITTGINNDVAKRIAANPEHATRLLGTRRISVTVPTSSIIDDTEKEYPVLCAPKTSSFSNIKLDKLQNKSIRLAAIRSIFRNSIDPASVAEATFPINTHTMAMQGLTRYGTKTRNYFPHRYPRNTRNTANPNSRELLHSHANRKIKSSQSGLIIRNKLRSIANVYATSGAAGDLSSRFHVVNKIVKNTTTNITEELLVHKDSLAGASEIHFLFELFDSENAIVDVIHRVINHEDLLEDYLTPDYPPIIYATPFELGHNALRVTQVDATATAIKIYRKKVSPLSSVTSTNYQLIETVPLTREDGNKRILDRVNNTQNCIYMAIAVGPRGSVSARARRAVCERYRSPLVPKKIEQELSHISIFAETSQDHVNIRVTNIPEGPCALYITATDMTSRPLVRNGLKDYRIVGRLPSDQIHTINSKSIDIEVPDYGVKDNHVYEYRCVLIYPNGKEEISKITELHEFKKEYVAQERAILNLDDLTVRADDESNLSITFEINAELTDVGINLVLDSLSAAGVGTNFVSEIQADRSKLSSILSFWVLRQDSISGVTEDMGIHLNGLFVDDLASRTKAGVSDLLSGRKYRYIIKVLLRSPESLFTGAASTTIDLETSRTFEKLVAKYFNPYTLTRGTLPSTSAALGFKVASRITSRSQFSLGRIGLERSIEATIPCQRCRISNVSAMKTGDNRNMIQWSITGNQNEVDHFLVMAVYQGVKSTVASTHNISDTGNYKVIDLDLSGELGSIEYSVIPVFSDYTYGTEVSAASITTDSEEPIFRIAT